MEEFIEVQNIQEVQQIDARRETSNIINDQIEQQNTNMDIISTQLDSIGNVINNIQSPDVKLSDVVDKIDELDTTIVTAQTADILEQLNSQQKQINGIEEKLDRILNAIEMKE